MARIVLISDDYGLSRDLAAEMDRRGHVVAPMQSADTRLDTAMGSHPSLLIVDYGSLSGTALAAWQSVLDRIELQCPVLGVFGPVDDVGSMQRLADAADTLARKPVAAAKSATGEYGFMHLDVHRREVTVRGNTLSLTPSETHILSILASRAGSYVTPQAIVAEMHGCEVGESEAGDIIRVHIFNLRHKFARIGGPPYIVSSRGRGYMLERRTRPASA